MAFLSNTWKETNAGKIKSAMQKMLQNDRK